MPTTTSLTSAPTPSQIAAMALMKLSLVARNAFAAYLMVSADAGSVTITGAPTPSYNDATFSAAAWSSQPTTTRSGLRKSCTAEPSRKNSGFETTLTSGRPITRSTTLALPTGTVDLLTTTASYGRTGPTSRAAASMYVRSADPSSPCGVGTHRNAISQSAAATAAPSTNDSRPSAMPSATRSCSPSSTIGITPRRRLAILTGSMSAQTTW